MWNPSLKELRDVEEDEAGRLARFRERFGRGFDADSGAGAGAKESGEEEEGGSLLDLLSGEEEGGKKE